MGGYKLTLPFRGKTIVETVVETALSVCSRIILVVGYRASDLLALFEGVKRVIPVENPSWELGMFSSIQRGIQAVETERFFISLADMPFVDGEVYRALLESPPADAVIPMFSGQRGHPVLLHSRVREAVMAENPETGRMRDVISRFSVGEIPWKDDSILRDVDTPRDFSRL